MNTISKILYKVVLVLFVLLMSACQTLSSGGKWLENAWDGNDSDSQKSNRAKQTATLASQNQKKRSQTHPLFGGGRWLEEIWNGEQKSPPSTYKERPSTNVWTQNNPRIEEFRKYYSSHQSSIVRVSLQRSAKYIPYIVKEFKKHQLPLELAYLPMLESAFQTDAVSPTGAKGLWQFITSTAKEKGLEVGWFRDERYDWKKATRAAALYLVELQKRFNGNWELALASYNGGPTYISQQMKKQKVNSYWNLKLKNEPYEYVPRFIAMLQVARDKYPKLYRI